MFFLIVFGTGVFGWTDYFEINGRPNAGCVVVRCFHILFIPLVPLEALVVFDPSPSVLACRGPVRCTKFKSCCTSYLWKCWAMAWLRFLTFGLLSCWTPQCSDVPAVMEALGIVTAAVAAASGGDNKYGGGGMDASLVPDNKESETRQAQDTNVV